MYICVYVCIYSLPTQVKTSHKKQPWLEWLDWRSKKQRKYSKLLQEGKKKIKLLVNPNKREFFRRVKWDWEAFFRFPRSKTDAPCAGVPGSHPTCRQGQAGAPCSQPGGAGGRRGVEMPARGSGWARASPAEELGGSTVPSAVRMLLFQQCRQETIQGNDYYILKEYGWREWRQPESRPPRWQVAGRHGDRRAPAVGTRAPGRSGARGRGRSATQSSPPGPVPGVWSFQGPLLCPFVLSSRPPQPPPCPRNKPSTQMNTAVFHF